MARYKYSWICSLYVTQTNWLAAWKSTFRWLGSVVVRASDLWSTCRELASGWYVCGRVTGHLGQLSFHPSEVGKLSTSLSSWGLVLSDCVITYGKWHSIAVRWGSINSYTGPFCHLLLMLWASAIKFHSTKPWYNIYVYADVYSKLYCVLKSPNYHQAGYHLTSHWIIKRYSSAIISAAVI